MLLHPRSALGLADGGAHVGIICDASMPTFMLTHWTPGPQARRAPAARVDRAQADARHRPCCTDLGDRGTLEPGKLADINLIDYEHLELETPRVAADLPAGGRRIVQDATGYVATIKRGVATFEHGEETGTRPGRLVRGSG